MLEQFLNGRVVLHLGDCREVLAQLDENSVDSCVTDPPYHLTSIVKRFGGENAAPAQFGSDGRYARASRGFMSKTWDGGDVAFRPETWAAVLRVLKPGAHMLVFGGTRTFARMAVAIEDAGFEIRDTIAWVYGSGFPKSHDVSKGIDRARNDECRHITAFLARHRDGMGLTAIARALGFPATDGTHGAAAFFTDEARLARVPKWDQWLTLKELFGFGNEMDAEVRRLNERKGQSSDEYASRPDAEYISSVGMRESWTDGRGWNGKMAKGGDPVRDAARQWAGWGSALKPAMELICVARKPLSEGTIAANVLKWGTGAINVDGCRVAHDEECKPMAAQTQVNSIIQQSGRYEATTELKANGRWPANLVHDGSDEVVEAFPETAWGTLTPDMDIKPSTGWSGGSYADRVKNSFDGNSGSAARFFYTAKADADDRLGSKHPTVKPLDLMQWLVRLVTPSRGLVLDPFAGTGTTAEAAWREGMRAVLIEAEAEYCEDIRRRMALALAGPDERAREGIKAKRLPVDYGPLFDWMREAAE